MDRHEGEIKVWDPVVRVFHWSLVLFVGIAFLAGEDYLKLHVQAGYGVIALVLFRLLWGLVGTRHARFSEFMYRPRVVLNYLKDLVTFRAKRYLGHGPAGGSMVIALLLGLLLTSVSGLAFYGGKKMAGPFAGMMVGVDPFWIKALEEVHEVLAGGTALLIGLHVAGVLFSSFAHRENLIKAMITGYKPKATADAPALEEGLR